MSTDNRRLPLRIAALALCLSGAAAGRGLGAADAGTRIRHVLGGRSFDHARFDSLLRGHVDGAGLVDYAGLARESAALDAYLASLASAPFEERGREEELALLINAYNAFTLRLILDHRPVASIKDIPSGKRWDDRRWTLAGGTMSLDQIDYERIRAAFREPPTSCRPLPRWSSTWPRISRRCGPPSAPASA